VLDYYRQHQSTLIEYTGETALEKLRFLELRLTLSGKEKPIERESGVLPKSTSSMELSSQRWSDPGQSLVDDCKPEQPPSTPVSAVTPGNSPLVDMSVLCQREKAQTAP
jgi:hypothetical protein